jgi:anti-sigma factor RsiW
MTHTNMKLEQALELQASVDGELEAGRKPGVERLMLNDATAAALAAELSAVRTAVRTHESAVTVPESREFYWSQIQRRIAAEEAVEARKRGSRTILGWIRWLAPAFGVAAVVAVLTMRTGSSIALADASVMTFRSDADAITIHWLN